MGNTILQVTWNYKTLNNVQMNIEILTPEQNEGMHYKPVLAPLTIGVITPYDRTYRMWIERIGFNKYPNATFKMISRQDDVRGVVFHGLEYGYQYWIVDAECVFLAKTRVVAFNGC